MTIFRVFFLLAVVFVAQPVYASAGADQSERESRLLVRVRNSVTGLHIPNGQVRILSGSRRNPTPGMPVLPRGRVVTLSPAPAGNIVQASAPGFRTMEVPAPSSAAVPSAMTIYLDPEGAGGNSDAEIRRLHSSGMMVLTGTVSDGETGEPLASVAVETGDGVIVSTGVDGRFVLLSPIAGSDLAVAFHRAGYRSVHYYGLPAWPNGDWKFTMPMGRGQGTDTKFFDNTPGPTPDESPRQHSLDGGTAGPGGALLPPTAMEPVGPAVLPGQIRIGRSCTRTSCTSVDVYSLETYARHVLPAEWATCWGSMPGGMHSLRAGAVAVRTVGAWYAYHPLSSLYDVCDNTSCQVFNPNLTSTNCNLAVDSTVNTVLIDTAGSIAFVQYSAENNDGASTTCGDGFVGTGEPAFPCIADPVCAGRPRNGHGHGVCQYGTARWATGSTIPSLCTIGTSHGFGTKEWRNILTHYYPSYAVRQAATANLLSASVTPAGAPPGSALDIQYAIQATGPYAALLDAGVRHTGTGTLYTDPAGTITISSAASDTIVRRTFTLPADALTGSYDLVAALRYDLNQNGLVDERDFVIGTRTVPDALVIAITGIDDNAALPRQAALRQNYPNPFNPRTNIIFAVPEESHVTLTIANVLGQTVATLVDERRTAGWHAVSWNAEGLPSGVYFYFLRINGAMADTRQMLLAR